MKHTHHFASVAQITQCLGAVRVAPCFMAVASPSGSLF